MTKIKSLQLKWVRMHIRDDRNYIDMDLWGNSFGQMTKGEAKKLIAWLEKWVNEN